ncbi:MAG: hypothetical protein E7620_09125 [Ruminococcaceae bacterium]|nr:hypothetical protein [Oscillospiraceae bacterium]
MDFHKTFSQAHCSGGTIDYGMIFGNEKIVLIKCGRGGSLRGYEDKHLKMALRLHSKYGCTVICSSNPIDCNTSYDLDQEIIRRYVEKANLSDFQLSLIGSSNGAYQNLFLANQLSQTKKLLCVNMPLMLNFHKSTRELQMMKNIEKIFVYGTNDPSYSYLPFLEIKKLCMLRAIRVDGADHQFKGRTDDFVALADLI